MANIFSRFSDGVKKFLDNPATIRDEVSHMIKQALGLEPIAEPEYKKKLNDWWAKYQPELAAGLNNQGALTGETLYNFIAKLKMYGREDTGLLRNYLQDQLRTIEKDRIYDFYQVDGPTASEQAAKKGYSSSSNFKYGIMYVSGVGKSWSAFNMTTDDIEKSTLTKDQRRFISYF